MGERTNYMVREEIRGWLDGLGVEHDAKLASSEQSF
jgi:hypothetical protein